MPNTLPKPHAAHPEVELYAPKPTQTRVIARHLNGESNRRIARVCRRCRRLATGGGNSVDKYELGQPYPQRIRVNIEPM
jgi:hypothetical protein